MSRAKRVRKAKTARRLDRQYERAVARAVVEAWTELMTLSPEEEFVERLEASGRKRAEQEAFLRGTKS